MVYGKDRSDDVMIWPLGIENAQWEKKACTRQPFRVFLAEISLIEIKRWFTIEFE
jgi:hypothetical protein